MRDAQRKVREFHEMIGLTDKPRFPALPKKSIVHGKVRHLIEEALEIERGLLYKDIEEIADGIADVIYVALDLAERCGIDIEPVFNEVHRSNMTKKDGHMNSDGKWIKPDNYEKPNIRRVLSGQMNQYLQYFEEDKS